MAAIAATGLTFISGVGSVAFGIRERERLNLKCAQINQAREALGRAPKTFEYSQHPKGHTCEFGNDALTFIGLLIVFISILMSFLLLFQEHVPLPLPGVWMGVAILLTVILSGLFLGFLFSNSFIRSGFQGLGTFEKLWWFWLLFGGAVGTSWWTAYHFPSKPVPSHRHK